MNKIINGKDEVKQKLGEISELVKEDNILNSNQTVFIKFDYKNGRLISSLPEDTIDALIDEADAYEIYTMNSAKPIKKRLRKAKELNQALQDINEGKSNMSISSFTLLAYLGCETNRDYEGKFITYWADIDPLYPYELDKDFNPIFKKRQILMNEEEFYVATATGIAINSGSQIKYLSKQSLLSLGRLIDSAKSLFDAENSIAACIFIGNKLADFEKLTMITERIGNITLIIGFGGSRFNYISQQNIWNMVENYLSSKGIWTVLKWDISVNQTSIKAGIGNKKDIGVLLEMSDIIDSPVTLSVFCEGANEEIARIANVTVKHDGKFVIDYATLDYALESIADFDFSKYADIKLNKSTVNEIRSIIGKKRFENADYEFNTLSDLFRPIKGLKPNQQKAIEQLRGLIIMESINIEEMNRRTKAAC